jgi:serine/threonine protein kinase
MISMLRQLIPGLMRLHTFGYSHGDLKPENICARLKHDGNVRFTLIDLGMASKLPKPGPPVSSKMSFRGNYMFAGVNQIEVKRAAAIDDLYSLLCVAYYFVNKTLPWITYIEEKNTLNPDLNLYVKENFI